jgi:hypothetical protein
MQAGREYEPQKTVVLVYMPFAHLWWHAPQHSLDHTTACNCGAEHLRRRVTKKKQRIGEGHRPVQIAQPSPDLRTSTTQYSGPATHPSVSEVCPARNASKHTLVFLLRTHQATTVVWSRKRRQQALALVKNRH